MVSAKDFVQKVWIPLLESWGYIYGTCGRMWTEALQKAWSEPGQKNYEQTKLYGAKWIGRKVTDCSGLPLWALKQLGETIVHQARYQYTDACLIKGKLSGGRREDGQPLLPGSCVFLQGSEANIHHVGVYVGHGICIEAKGTRWGVVTSKPDHWDHWGELKVVDYTDAAEIEEEPVPEIPEKRGEEDVLFRARVNNPGKWLNVRSRPESGSPVKFRLEKGDEVAVVATSADGKWWEVKFYGSIGWASAEYLEKLEEPEDPVKEEDKMSAAQKAVNAMRQEVLEIKEKLDLLGKLVNELEDTRAIREKPDQLITRLAGHPPDGGE